MQPIYIFDHPTAVEIIAECRHRLQAMFGKPVKVEAIIHYHLDDVMLERFAKDCADAFGVSITEIFSNDRSQPLISYRQAIIYAAYIYSTKGLKEVGRAFNKDHSTIVHTVGKMAGFIQIGDKVAIENMKVINQLIKEKCHSTNLDAVENLG